MKAPIDLLLERLERLLQDGEAMKRHIDTVDGFARAAVIAERLEEERRQLAALRKLKEDHAALLGVVKYFGAPRFEPEFAFQYLRSTLITVGAYEELDAIARAYLDRVGGRS